MTGTVMRLQISGDPSGDPCDALDAHLPSTVQQAPATLSWLSPVEVPLDLNGPVDRSFDPLEAGFACVPAIEHLIAVTAKFADRVAISDGNHSFTYAQLLSRVLTLAQAISALIPEQEAVGWLLRSSAWQPIAMLACMAAGRVLVPLNPRDPVQRLTAIAAAARISVLIGQDGDSSAGWIQQHGLRWLDVAGASDPSAATSTLPKVSVDAPAVVLYTSGSTGAPKGVVNSQRNLLQRVQQYVDACHIGAADVFMPLSGPTTIAGCREMLSALLTGARLHIVDVEALGLRSVLRQITTQQVTITYVVPALVRALINASRPGDLDSLRMIRIGGEKVLWTDIALVRRAIPPGCFIQVSYLSTETTGTQWFLPKQWREDGVSVPVGYLLPGISYAVVDESGKPAQQGEVGELVIKSRYVMLGYWEDGRLSPASPSPDDPKSRIYQTGDLVIVDTHGLMRIVGRKGRQLKINGQRVEPAELESALRKLTYVKDAVAVVTDANELVLFASPADPPKAHFRTDVRNSIRQAVPAALHPTRLHEIQEMPRLPGGKIDHAKLKLLDLESKTTSPAPVPTMQGMAEANRIVQQVWTSILGVPEAAGRWDEAGGDSLKLLRCVMDIEDLIGREVSMEAFTVDMSAEDMIRAIATVEPPVRQRLNDQILPGLVILPGSMGYGPSMAAFGAQLGQGGAGDSDSLSRSELEPRGTRFRAGDGRDGRRADQCSPTTRRRPNDRLFPGRRRRLRSRKPVDRTRSCRQIPGHPRHQCRPSQSKSPRSPLSHATADSIPSSDDLPHVLSLGGEVRRSLGPGGSILQAHRHHYMAPPGKHALHAQARARGDSPDARVRTLGRGCQASSGHQGNCLCLPSAWRDAAPRMGLPV
ncbi:non-ribosomal peptide synthetase component F [Bradyrhizobium sp. i1.7.7]